MSDPNEDLAREHIMKILADRDYPVAVADIRLFLVDYHFTLYYGEVLCLCRDLHQAGRIKITRIYDSGVQDQEYYAEPMSPLERLAAL